MKLDEPAWVIVTITGRVLVELKSAADRKSAEDSLASRRMLHPMKYGSPNARVAFCKLVEVSELEIA